MRDRREFLKTLPPSPLPYADASYLASRQCSTPDPHFYHRFPRLLSFT